MKLTTLEDDFGKFTPIQPQRRCGSCGSKGVNINITNTANGNTASGNSNSTSNPTSSANNGFTNTQTAPERAVVTTPSVQTIPAQNPAPVIIQRESPKTDDDTRSLLQKILDKLNTPREPQRMETERKPERVKYLVKEREVKVPVDRPIPFVKQELITDIRDRPVPYVKENEIIVEKDRPVPYVKDRELIRFLDRVKEKVTVIRANQPPAPPSFS